MVLGEIIVEGVYRVEPAVQRHVQVSFGPSTDEEGKTVAQIVLQGRADSGQSLAVAVNREAATKLIAALALALPRLG